MPAPNDLFDRNLQRETHFDSDELRAFVQANLALSGIAATVLDGGR